jgi:hypothetical protein
MSKFDGLKDDISHPLWRGYYDSPEPHRAQLPPSFADLKRLTPFQKLLVRCSFPVSLYY